jgi:tRNA threonylcarbamoyladenosine biosynthesis protein TsaB
MKNTPPLLLCIDTTEKSCSACVARGSVELARRRTDETYKHSETLGPFVRDLLLEAGLELGDLSGIVINKGPGSYTGLRVGFAFAKALSFASGVPILGVNALEALADNQANKMDFDLCLPMMDARRMEVYTAVYDQNLKEIEPPHPLVLDQEFFDREVFRGKSVAIVGSGAAKTTHFKLAENFLSETIDNDASYLIKPGIKRIQEGKVEDTAYFEPLYLKEARITQPKQTLRS